MKKALLIILTLCTCMADAQNYNCLQSGVKRYFTNSNGYLRGMRIDSVRTNGTDIIYYPYHTPRGRYDPLTGHGSLLDTNGGSWLGKKVITQSSGTLLFDNIWHDTVVVKTQAHLGDSWIFYNDTTPNYYRATLVALDTMSVLGVLDSVKKIIISSYNASGPVTADSLNGFQLILSKNNGFVQVFDLYTFPYHAPDSAYMAHLDYYLDAVVSDPFTTPIPKRSNSIFSIVNYSDPTMTQLNDWNIGDVIEYSMCSSYYYGTCVYPYQYSYDSIIGKTVYPDSIRYDYQGWLATQHAPQPYMPNYVPDQPYPYDTHTTAFSVVFTSSFLTDTTLMPEEYRQKQLQYYFPLDATLCLNSALYKFFQSDIVDSAWENIHFESSGVQLTYKTGLGLLHYYLYTLGNPAEEVDDKTLRYYKRGGVSCGTFVTPIPNDVAAPIQPNFSYALYPNPATKELTISGSDKITNIVITNMLGQQLYASSGSAVRLNINISLYPPGIYFVKVNGTDVRKFIKQ